MISRFTVAYCHNCNFQAMGEKGEEMLKTGDCPACGQGPSGWARFATGSLSSVASRHAPTNPTPARTPEGVNVYIVASKTIEGNFRSLASFRRQHPHATLQEIDEVAVELKRRQKAAAP